MNAIERMPSRNASRKFCILSAGIVAVCLLLGACAVAAPSPWWDCPLRLVATTDLQTALDYHTTVAMNGVGSDPGWGPWFTWSSPGNFNNLVSTRQSFQAAGIQSASYTTGFGMVVAVIASTGTGTPLPITCQLWDWQLYNGTDPIEWAGCWTWFDDAAFARPYTRTGPTCSGSPMTYPDGTVATGFLNNNSTDPRNSRVYDCGVHIRHLWQRLHSYGYLSPCNAPG